MRQLTALDALFLAAENDRTHGHVSALGVYDPVTASGRPLDAALVRELVTERIHLLPPLRWRLAGVPLGLDHPYWVDEGTVDVDYHVRDVALPSPGDQRQLAEQVAHLIASHLDRARPLWEMYVIHGLQDGAVAMLTKMHHAAVDGVSGAEVMRVLLDDTAAGRELEPAPDVPTERFPSEVEMLGRGVVGMLRHPIRALRAMPTTLPHLDDVPTIRHLPGVKMIARGSRQIKRLVPAADDGTVARASTSSRPGLHSKPRYRRIVGSRSGRCPLMTSRRSRRHSAARSMTLSWLCAPPGCAPGSTSGVSYRPNPCWASSRCRYGPASRWGPSATRSRP